MSDKNVISVSSEVMNKRVANFEDQIPNKTMMITQRMEGYKREIYSIIGRGVSEDFNTKPAITESMGFNLAYVGAEPGNGSTLHTHHDEVEVFIPFSGQWSVFWNEGEKREEAIVGPMDCISVPPNVMRGFTNVGSDYGYLMVVISGNENKAVTRPKDVVEGAAKTGLTLNDKGHISDAAE